MEAFFSTVKTELGDRFETGDEATRALFEHVEAFFNSALAPFQRSAARVRLSSSNDRNRRRRAHDNM
jgi:hypothetical protein